MGLFDNIKRTNIPKDKSGGRDLFQTDTAGEKDTVYERKPTTFGTVNKKIDAKYDRDKGEWKEENKKKELEKLRAKIKKM